MVQLQILNKILDTRDSSIITLNGLTNDYFPEYKNEFLFIKEHLDKYGQVPDKSSFLAKFPDFTIINVNESDSYLLEQLYEDYNTRYLANAFNNVKNLIEQNKLSDAMSAFKQSYDGLKSSVSLSTIDITQDTSRYDDYASRIDNFDKYYVKTGFKELDRIIGGWDRNEELATIVARPGVGKTWVLLKCAVASAEQGLNVGIYSGEMSERKIGYRADTLIGHISNSKLIRGSDDIMVEYKKHLESLATKIPGTLKVITPAMINGPAGVTALRAFIEKEKLDILFIDQHSLLEDDRKAKDPVTKAANISRDLKNLQVMKKIPIIAVSQQNRTEGPQSTSQVAQSDRIAQDSTILIFLSQKDSILTLNLVKSRDSVNDAKIQYAVDLNTGTFTYIPNEQDSPEQSYNLKESYESTDNQGANVF